MNYQESLDAFHSLDAEEPQVLQAVYERVVDACREALRLQFPRKSLLLTADADDDTLSVRVEETQSFDLAGWTRVDSQEPWLGFVGSSFGWGWITVNQQGYADGALLSFDGINPTVLLHVSASSIRVSSILAERKTVSATP